MAKKEPAVCDECGSLFFKGSSQMMGLCPECAHILYGYPNCPHHFQNGRCVNCYWDGSKSGYIKELNQQEDADMPTTEWLNNWTIPGTDCNLPVFSSGWGDGYYPVYFGYGAKGEICAVYVRFIDIEACYKEQA